MRTLILLTIVLTIVSADKWAVLVAGSNTWSNYRHQADIFHAYQLLLKNAFDPQNIITFAYDDIANDLKNPFRGKVFNKPSGQDPGVDVYEGVKIDYSKNDVTPDVFLSVLMGNKTAVKGKGSEKVLESTADDNVFLFFSDHGAVGLIAFPTKYLYADSLLQTFAAMKGRYKKLVFYLEACESGSMFLKLPNNTGIYALSAANPTESSWATYCSPNDVIQGKHIGSCLGDLFSCNFIEETEKDNFLTEKLNDQFLKLKYMTTESEVMQWGDKSFLSDKVGDFVAGYLRNPRFKLLTPLIRTNRGPEVAKKVDSRTNKLQALAAIYAREHSPQVLEEMKAQMDSMLRFDTIFSHLKGTLKLPDSYDVANIRFDCLRDIMDSFEDKCGHLSDYGLIYVKYLATACEYHQSQTIINTISC